MGRPRIDRAEKKRHHMTTTLNDEEFIAALEASKSSQSTSEWLRALIRSAVGLPPLPVASASIRWIPYDRYGSSRRWTLEYFRLDYLEGKITPETLVHEATDTTRSSVALPASVVATTDRQAWISHVVIADE